MSLEKKVKSLACDALITKEVVEKKKNDKAKKKEEDLAKKQKKSDTKVYKMNLKSIDPTFYLLYAGFIGAREAEIEKKKNEINSLFGENIDSKKEEQITKALNDANALYADNIRKLFESYKDIIEDIILYEIKYKEPKSTYSVKYDEFCKTAETNANKIFTETQKNKVNEAKLKAINANVLVDALKKIDDINATIAEIPKKIEDEIKKIRSVLDKILGKIDVDIDSVDWEAKEFAAPIMNLITPFTAAFNPLTSIVPPVPVVGNLNDVISNILADSKTSTVSKEDIKKMAPKLPEAPSGISASITAIKDDIMLACTTIPMLLINIIFLMIDVIYLKLKIITSVIPLGVLFPLNLITAAETAVAKGMSLITGLPGMMSDMIRGHVRKKMAEAMVNSIPKPLLPPPSTTHVIPTNPGSPKKKLTYLSVNLNLLAKKLSDLGLGGDSSLSGHYFSYLYTEYDLNKILENYRKIHVGIDSDITYYSITDGTTELLKQEKVNRDKSTPESYELYLDELVKSSEISSSLKYLKYITTKDLIGELHYSRYKDHIAEKNKHVVIAAEIIANGSIIKKAKSIDLPDFSFSK